MHIPTFKMPTTKQVWEPTPPGDHAFLLDLVSQMQIYHYYLYVHVSITFYWQQLLMCAEILSKL